MSTEQHNYHFLMNEQSFTWLFNTYWEKVYSICYQNTNSYEDSRELTQNIFKSLWERRNDMKITGNPEHYLMRSAKLQVINFYRDNKIQEEHHSYFYQAYCDVDHCTEKEVLFNQLNDKLGMLVDSLPCQCKNIYQLSRENNLSNKQIADALSISVKTVEYHLANASKLLKNNLKDFI